MVRNTRFELVTSAMSRHCSTTELIARFMPISGRRPLAGGRKLVREARRGKYFLVENHSELVRKCVGQWVPTSSLLHFFTSSLLHFFTSSLLHFFTSALQNFRTSIPAYTSELTLTV